VRFPAARYFSIGTYTLWGPNRGTFEFDVLAKEKVHEPISYPTGRAFFLGRVLGSVPMKAPVFVGHSMSHRRDPSAMFSTPFLNPAPDAEGILRFICQTKPLASNAYLLKLDQLRLDMPPPTEEGWREFEDGVTPVATGGLAFRRPKYGNFAWSGWGAVILSGQPGARALMRGFFPAAQDPSEVVIRGSLGPTQGSWQVRASGSKEPVTLDPGKDEDEVAEWRIPVSGITAPAEIELEITCTAAGARGERQRRDPDARLVLDAWTLR